MSKGANNASIKAIDKTSIHRITSGQVVVDLQTAVKELVENSLDAGATNIEVRFKQYGLTSIEVIDNGTGIAEEDCDSIGLKHYTSKLATYTDLSQLRTFGFRGEALSSLCAVCQSVQVTTSTHPPVGVCLDLEPSGRVKSRKTVARPKGTTVSLKGLFHPLPVRRKELERNIKREFAKILSLLSAYALLPCAAEPGVRLSVTNQLDKGARSQLLITQGTPSMRASVTALWGPKALDNIVDLDLKIEVERERGGRRIVSTSVDEEPLQVCVRGLISKFSVGCGRTGTDRQFVYVNGRPCTLNKVQKAFNEVYRSFNATQSPFIIADFILPTESCDVNVSPDKRTIFLHNENNMISALKSALENNFNPTRSTFDVKGTQANMVQTTLDRPSTHRQQQQTTTSKKSPPLGDKPSSPNRGSDESQPMNHSPQPSSPAQPTNTSPSAPSIDSLGNGSTLPAKTPLFIPDPEDEVSPEDADAGGTTTTLGVAMIPEVMTENPEDQPKQKQQDGDTDEEEIVIDTTRASWNQPTLSQIAPPLNRNTGENGEVAATEDSLGGAVNPERSTEGELSTDDEPNCPEEPPQKKRKTDVDTLTPWITTKPASINGKARVSVAEPDEAQPPVGDIRDPSSSATQSKIRKGQMTMHKFLSGFASSSSQPRSDVPEEGTEDMEITEEGDIEMEGGGAKDVQDANQISEDSPMQAAVDPLPGPLQDVQAHDPTMVDSEQFPNPLPTDSDHTPVDDFETDELDISSVLSSVQQSLSSSPGLSRIEQISRPEITRGNTDNDITLKFDFEKVKNNWTKLITFRTTGQPSTRVDADALEDAGLSNTENEAKVAEILSRIIDKTDFSMMEVVGQFNLGFIIARRRKADTNENRMDDLFIVDQHAADEKYNFETLQQTTNIQSQKLFQSRLLELTASDELVATENIDILRKNGFEIDIDSMAPSGARLKLTAQPISKSTVFDMKDLEEIIDLMRDRPKGHMVRCSKARVMFAMRACRKSVMIGMPLNRHQMLSVVRHMGTMDQPWNCPHGRPTMRHLVDLESVRQPKREVDWRRLTLIS